MSGLTVNSSNNRFALLPKQPVSNFASGGVKRYENYGRPSSFNAASSSNSSDSAKTKLESKMLEQARERYLASNKNSNPLNEAWGFLKSIFASYQSAY